MQTMQSVQAEYFFLLLCDILVPRNTNINKQDRAVTLEAVCT